MLGLLVGITGLATGIEMEKRDSSGSVTRARTTSASWDNEWNKHGGDDWRRQWCRARRRGRGNGWESDWYWRRCKPWDRKWMNSYH